MSQNLSTLPLQFTVYVLLTFSLPLTQCKQKFAAMDVQSRDNLKQSIDDSAKKYQLDDITYSSFIAQFGYKTKVLDAFFFLKDVHMCEVYSPCEFSIENFL